MSTVDDQMQDTVPAESKTEKKKTPQKHIGFKI